MRRGVPYWRGGLWKEEGLGAEMVIQSPEVGVGMEILMQATETQGKADRDPSSIFILKGGVSYYKILIAESHMSRLGIVGKSAHWKTADTPHRIRRLLQLSR